MKNKSDVYLPHIRSYYEPDKDSLVNESPVGGYSILPNPVEDPIVSNNIACMEFTYIDDEF